MTAFVKPGKRHPFLALLKAVLTFFFRRPRIICNEQILPGKPVVFICNHLDSYGPIITSLYFPYPFKPWIHAHMMTPDLCPDYLEADFIRKTLKWRPPFSKWLAGLLAPLCISLFNSVEAIPVYRGRMRIRDTMKISLDVLTRGDNLLIFPENPKKKYIEHVRDFHTGFVNLGRSYFGAAGKCLAFYPVFISKKERTIRIGPPALYNPEKEFFREKERILEYLRKTINDMAAESR